jgi:hypothetical protein
VSNKRIPSETRIAGDILRVLADIMPPTWSLETKSKGTRIGTTINLLVEAASPDGQTARFALDVKRAIEPRSAKIAGEQISEHATAADDAIPVLAAGYLSPRTRQLLDGSGVGYIDTTGNVRIASSAPGLFVRTQGADRDPWPQDAELRSLRGRGAARALRAIVDTAPPFGTRELAGAASVSAATLSRVLDLLDREAIVTRQRRGPVLAVDWQAAIRRWADDYDQTTTNTATTFLDLRGTPSLEKRLETTEVAYAATGAFAAQRFDPIAPARTATLYVEDVVETAERLDLPATDVGCERRAARAIRPCRLRADNHPRRTPLCCP